MFATYMPSTNNTTGGVALDAAGNDVEVVAILIGNPTASANIWIYDQNNVGNTSNTTGIKVKLTLPASFATGQLPFKIDTTDGSGHGLICGMGGSVAIDQNLQATVIWGYAQQNSNTI